MPKDLTLAFEYYKLAAELGDGEAQNSLATCYQDGVVGATTTTKEKKTKDKKRKKRKKTRKKKREERSKCTYKNGVLSY